MDGFLEELSRLSRHKQRHRARWVLMWLSVAQRPLLARDLCIAVQVRDASAWNLAECSLKDDSEPASFIRNLVGGLVSVDQDTQHVTIPDELRTLVLGETQPTEQAGALNNIRRVTFSLAQAHTVVAHTCLTVCALTTLHLTRMDHDNTIPPSLVSYAWEHGVAHLKRAGTDPLRDKKMAAVTDKMVLDVCTDTQTFLLCLNDTFTGPVAVATWEERAAYTALIREVQAALGISLWHLMKLLSYGQGYEQVSAVLRSDRAAGRGDQGTRSLEKLLQHLAGAARGLRHLSAVLAFPQLQEELRKGYPDWSPCSLLDTAAHLMGSIAGYTQAVDFNPPEPASHCKLAAPNLASLSQVSHLRLTAARLVYCLSCWLWRAGDGTYTINDPQLARRRTTSFDVVAAEMQPGAGGFRAPRLARFLPRPLRDFFHEVVKGFLKAAMVPFDNFAAGLLAGGRGSIDQVDGWPRIKEALLARGYRVAVALLVIAIVLHHVRSVATPRLVGYIWLEPLEGLRFALSGPDAFLREMLAVGWRWALVTWAQRYIMDMLTAVFIMVFLADAQRRKQVGWVEERTVIEEAVFEGSKVLYLVRCLAVIEYTFTRAVYTVAFLIAYGKLASGGEAERAALKAVVTENEGAFLATAFDFWICLESGILPVAWASLLYAVGGQPGLLLVILAVVGGVWAIINYRSMFFIALQMSGLFVALGFLILMAVLLGLEFLNDPLGLSTSTSAARKLGLQASAQLLMLPHSSERETARRSIPPRAARPQPASQQPAPQLRLPAGVKMRRNRRRG